MTSDIGALEYLLPETLDPAELEQRLTSYPGVTVENREDSARTLLDTFDWRLYRNGTGIEHQSGGTPLLRWYRLADGRTLHQSPTAAPRFAWDLPTGTFRRALGEQLEMRALLPRAQLRCRSAHLALRDQRQKQILRLRIEENTLLGNPEVPLRPRLLLEPVKGYPEALVQARLDLLGSLPVEPANQSLLGEALALLQLNPSGYSSKVRVALGAEMPAEEAVRVVLLQLLDMMEANEAGTLADTDSEFLHDFRVAVRRTRSALGQLKAALPRAARDRFRDDFAWLGAMTSPTRDLDVYLLTFPAYQGSLPPETRADLEPLRAFLQRLQQREQQTLAEALRSRRYRALKRDWRELLESAPWGEDAPPSARLPVLAVARKRIWKIYRRALQEGAQLHAGSPAERFHELRKTCKELRYLLEFFQSLFPAKQVGSIIKTLKTLQDNLGTYNDLEVQAAAMSRFGRLMQKAGEAPAECLIAMGMLAQNLTHRQATTRDAFASRFAEFSGAATDRSFRKLFAPRGAVAEEGAER